MQSTKLFEDRIKKTLVEASEQVTASELLKKRIHNEISNQKMKEGCSMKKIKTIRKIAIIAAAICCLTSVSVYAAGKLTGGAYISTSSKEPTYTKLPSAKELTNSLGFVPKEVNSFSNGYKFESAHIKTTKAVDDYNKELYKFKEIGYKLKSEKGKSLMLYANKNTAQKKENTSKINATNYNGIEIKYNEQMYKFVPENYEMTDEEKAAQDNGTIVFSYGTEKVTTSMYKFTNWTDNGINYMIMAEDNNLTEADFVGMAKELISQ